MAADRRRPGLARLKFSQLLWRCHQVTHRGKELLRQSPQCRTFPKPQRCRSSLGWSDVHLDCGPRRAEDVSWPHYRAAHFKHSPARTDLSSLACVNSRNGRHRRPRPRRIWRRHDVHEDASRALCIAFRCRLRLRPVLLRLSWVRPGSLERHGWPGDADIAGLRRKSRRRGRRDVGFALDGTLRNALCLRVNLTLRIGLRWRIGRRSG